MLSKNFVPIDIAGLKLRYRSVPAIVRSYSGAHAEAPLGEVESVAGGVADAIVLNPAHERLINAALINQILEQTADRITGEGGDDGAFHTEAALQPTRDVVLSRGKLGINPSGNATGSFLKPVRLQSCDSAAKQRNFRVLRSPDYILFFQQ